MKRLYVLVMTTVACIVLASCESDDQVTTYINIVATEKMLNMDKEDPQYSDVGDADIFDFAYIKGAPKAKDDYDVDDIIKMYASTGSFDDPQPPIAIDIENNEIYVEPNIGRYGVDRSEEHTSELQSRGHLVCRLLLEKKNRKSTRLTSDQVESMT